MRKAASLGNQQCMAQRFRTETLILSGQDVTGIFYPLTGNPSGFVLSSQTGSFITTGQTGVFGASGNFYPLNSNPSGYITTGQTGNFGGGSFNTGTLVGTFYLNSNPSGYITGVNTGSFITTGQTGAFYPLGFNPSGYITGEALFTANSGSYVTITQSGLLTGSFYPLTGNPSGFILPSQTGGFITTGQTGAFYPLGFNPSGYITTGQTGNFGGGSFNTGTLVGTFYLNSNPSGYITGLNTGSFITTGQTGAFYPLGFNPSGYITTGQTGNFGGGSFNTGTLVGTFAQLNTNQAGNLNISGSGNFISGLYLSGNQVVTGGPYYLNSNPSGYITTGQTGAFGGGGVTNPAWGNLTFGATTTWNTASNVCEDKQRLTLTGSSTLAISGLYNGWAGLLQTIQSGSGYNLTLPSGTKVAYNGSGVISLTTGISGARDMVSFVYDGTYLFANIANYFN